MTRLDRSRLLAAAATAIVGAVLGVVGARAWISAVLSPARASCVYFVGEEVVPARGTVRQVWIWNRSGDRAFSAAWIEGRSPYSGEALVWREPFIFGMTEGPGFANGEVRDLDSCMQPSGAPLRAAAIDQLSIIRADGAHVPCIEAGAFFGNPRSRLPPPPSSPSSSAPEGPPHGNACEWTTREVIELSRPLAAKLARAPFLAEFEASNHRKPKLFTSIPALRTAEAPGGVSLRRCLDDYDRASSGLGQVFGETFALIGDSQAGEDFTIRVDVRPEAYSREEPAPEPYRCGAGTESMAILHLDADVWKGSPLQFVWSETAKLAKCCSLSKAAWRAAMWPPAEPGRASAPVESEDDRRVRVARGAERAKRGVGVAIAFLYAAIGIWGRSRSRGFAVLHAALGAAVVVGALGAGFMYGLAAVLGPGPDTVRAGVQGVVFGGFAGFTVGAVAGHVVGGRPGLRAGLSLVLAAMMALLSVAARWH